jgi:hypothetical protein
MSVHDCVRRFGADGTCGNGQFGTPSCLAPDCEPHGTATCDGSIAVVCGIDGDFILYNCAEQDPAGTCTVVDGTDTYCGGVNVQPI